MPPVVFIAILGAAGIAGYKFLSAMMHPGQTPVSKATRQAAPAVRDLGQLEWDERAGVYRPQGKREG